MVDLAVESPVVRKLASLLAERPSNYEITILPTSSASTEERLSLEESLLLIEGEHLGLDARSLPWMTQEIRACYKQLRKEVGLKEPQTILAVTACLLLVNPDHATTWADRRRSLLRIVDHQQKTVDNDDGDSISKLWRDELKFVNLLTTQHSKAPSSWGHRKYVLKKCLESLEASRTSSLDELLDAEVEVCRRVAEKYPKNYYAWTHRRFLWTLVGETMVDQWKREWRTMLKDWLPKHISDHSAAHYASQMLSFLVKEASHSNSKDNSTKFDSLMAWAKEAAGSVRDLVERHEDHETLWILFRLTMRVFWDSKLEKLRSIAREEIERVATRVLDKNSTDPTGIIVTLHAWTFLAWCHETLQPTSGDESHPVMQTSIYLDVLQNHPKVNHRLWITS